jgi:excisionase family DNA binding protein
MDKLVDVNEVSELLGAKIPTIYGWVSKGLIPNYKIGRLVRFSPKEVRKWLERRHRKGRNGPPDIVL